ncbi:MAG: hypothetical protein MI867_24770, partial [Pseudomonadales bacterium]|nr:hypothetical protein [Pseudomonadales bacterium]
NFTGAKIAFAKRFREKHILWHPDQDDGETDLAVCVPEAPEARNHTPAKINRKPHWSAFYVPEAAWLQEQLSREVA